MSKFKATMKLRVCVNRVNEQLRSDNVFVTVDGDTIKNNYSFSYKFESIYKNTGFYADSNLKDIPFSTKHCAANIVGDPKDMKSLILRAYQDITNYRFTECYPDLELSIRIEEIGSVDFYDKKYTETVSINGRDHKLDILLNHEEGYIYDITIYLDHRLIGELKHIAIESCKLRSTLNMIAAKMYLDSLIEENRIIGDYYSFIPDLETFKEKK